MTKIGRQLAGYGAAYYPAPDSSGRGGARITAGQKIVADISVEAQPLYTIEGGLNVPTGFSVALSLRPRDRTAEPEAGGMGMRRDGNSFKILMVPKGEYVLQASAHVENKNWYADVPLHVAGDVTGLQIALQPGVSIPVNISTQRTQTISQPQVFSTHLQVGLPMQVILNPTDRLRQSYVPTPRPPDNSSFAFDGVAPGTYKLDFSQYGDLYVASARYGSVDLLRENLLVLESSSDAIELVLRDDGAKLKGSIVSDGQPAEGALLIVPEHGDAYAPGAMSRSSNGDFEIRNLAPGSYSILAFDSLDNLEYSNPDALAPYLSHAAHVDLAANQETSVTLELIKRGDEE
jgi:hypothetical protein